MTIPKEIKLGNRTIPISVAPIDGNVMGYYDSATQEIYLSDNLTEPQLIETFWHELMHAIFDYHRFSADLRVELANSADNGGETMGQDSYDFEERLAEDFALTFLQIIQDNNLANVKA